MKDDSRVYDYLNNHLDPQARLAFEQDMAQDPLLAETVEMERALMARIRDEFNGWEPPALDDLAHARLHAQWKKERTRRLYLLPPLLAAAALAAGFLWLKEPKTPPPPQPAEVRMVMASQNPLITIYVVDPLPADLWKGDETP